MSRPQGWLEGQRQLDMEAHAVGGNPASGTPVAGVDLADRGRRLFEFLAQAQMLKTTPPRTTDAYLREGSVLWMGDLPVHAGVSSAHRTAEPDLEQPLLTVHRIPALTAPPIPPSLQPWLDGPGDDADDEPKLRDRIPNPEADSSDEADAERALEDHPDVQELYELWQPKWAAWAEKERTDRPVRDLYTELFSTYVKVTAHPEELELILGIGCLAWNPPGHHPLRRHVMTSPATVTFDDDTGTITVSAQPGLETLTVELDMLDPSLVPNPVHVNDVRARARDFEQHPMHRTDVGDLIRRLVHSLDANSEYRDEDELPGYSDTPLAAFAPALIVRRRSQRGLVDIFHTIAAEIAESGAVPSGLLPLLDPDHVPSPADAAPSVGAIVEVDGEVFLPLPLNQVQLDIVRRVDGRPQTLVQGPPGTGKTHTAAALLTHLLAQGKRVLVTAHTDRALKEVRGKLPESIKPLAVAVVGSDRSDMADLKVAVERLSARSSDHDPAEAHATISNCLESIDGLRRQRARIRHQLVEARNTEVRTHEHAGYAGTLAAIAQDYQAQAAQHGWIAELVTARPDVPPPLSANEATRWLGLVRDSDLAADEAEAEHRLVDLDDIPSPATFAAHVDDEAAAQQGAAAFSALSDHAAFDTISALAPEVRARLRDRMRELARRAAELEQHHDSWTNTALRDIRAGRQATWAARAGDVRELIGATRPAVDFLGATTQVTIAETADRGALTALAQHLHAHVSQTGPIKTNADGTAKIGAFTSKAIKQARPLLDAVRVDGQTPTTVSHLSATLAHLEAERQLAALDRAWPADVLIPAEDTLRERLQWHATELEQLDRLLALGEELGREEPRLAELGLARPDWNDVASVLVYARLVDAAGARDAHAAASQPVQLLEATTAVATWADAAPAVRQLHVAVRARDRDQYSTAHARLARLHAVRELAADRDALTSRCRDAAPDLAAEVLAEPFAPGWDERIPHLPDAWDWARTGAWILEQDSTDSNVLQAQINAIETRLRRDIEVLAATRAWDHALSPSRLTGQSRADLTQYAQLVRRLGRGTGKYATARRGEIRIAMDRCRPAVPVWIMPIYRIAEQLRITQNMFDVVIVDEASQAGLEATFLQYLAPKIVVIGDDKQVSPTAVGVDQQQLRDLANIYLYDDRYKASWQDPKRSLFDEANMRFGSKLTLVEHRRCVPEIIGFSNRIAYEPEGIRLIPVRQYGADRLEPIKTVHVTDGYERGPSGNKVNPAEVDAIVAQLEKCLADPRYDGLTFGVVSLLGQTQARRIESALLERIPAEEWTARDLRCGDAADFQGSERDVIFLSMVSAPEPGQRLGALTAEMYMQRYNVAASRAKDQLWVFHSIGLDQLSNPEDMRHHLLDYSYGVIGRSSAEQGEGAASPVPEDVRVEPFDSLFEQRVYNRLIDRGFTVIPQFPTNGYNLDLVVVGSKGKLAIECDGDAWHGPEAYERDLARQRDLERCGWQFFRIRESAFYVDQHSVLARLWGTLDELDIRPSGWLAEALVDEEDDEAPEPETGAPDDVDASDLALFTVDGPDPAGAPVPEVIHDETHRADAGPPEDTPAPQLPSVAERMQVDLDDTHSSRGANPSPQSARGPAFPTLPTYAAFDGELVPALAATRTQLVDALRDIVAVEGPVLGSRIHSTYVLASGQRQVGKQIAHALNAAITYAVRKGILIADNPLRQSGVKPRTYRLPGQNAVIIRQLGPRTLDQVPPMELACLLRAAATISGWDSTESLYRDVLHRLGRERLTGPAAQVLSAVVPLAKSLDQGDAAESLF